MPIAVGVKVTQYTIKVKVNESAVPSVKVNRFAVQVRIRMVSISKDNVSIFRIQVKVKGQYIYSSHKGQCQIVKITRYVAQVKKWICSPNSRSKSLYSEYR